VQANSLVLVFLGEASACRHEISSAGNQRQSRPSVYKIGYGPDLLPGHRAFTQLELLVLACLHRPFSTRHRRYWWYQTR